MTDEFISIAGPCLLVVLSPSSVKMKAWFRILTIASILLKLVGVLMWLVQAGYSATQGE